MSNVGSGHVLINNVLYTNEDAKAYPIESDTVIVTEYYEVTVTTSSPPNDFDGALGEGYKREWSKNVIEGEDGKLYAHKGDKATLTITTGEITKDGNWVKLTITGGTLKSAKFDTSNASSPVDVDLSAGTILFVKGETWDPGTIVVEVTVSTANKVDVSWGNA